jgi:hypothetical protein
LKKVTFLFVISRFHKLVAFLKKQNERYVPKKAKVLTKEQVETFILEAPDEKWLLSKVINYHFWCIWLLSVRRAPIPHFK